MKQEVIGKTIISPLNLGTCFSYELCGAEIRIRFLGIMPAGSIPLQEVREFRVATRSEAPGLAFKMNHFLYYCWRPAYHPIYLLRTQNARHFLKLNHASQLRLRKAVKRSRAGAQAWPKAA
ncbi:hypothetical protein [Pontiella sp.]|uniref:hypothetical protein n=1 Tax=Pontiella sp. TaxID=2837462 RepID=UPI0035632184